MVELRSRSGREDKIQVRSDKREETYNYKQSDRKNIVELLSRCERSQKVKRPPGEENYGRGP